MAPRYPVRQEDFLYDLHWTEAMDKLFIEVLLDQQAIGNFIPGELNESALHICMHVINNTFNQTFSYRYCLGRLAMLEKRYRVFYWLKRKHGVKYNEETNTVTAPEHVWDEIFQLNEFSIAYQEFGEPRWNDLKVLFDGLNYETKNVKPEVIDISDDSDTNDIGNVDALPKPSSQKIS
ncbi:hypothetical protein DH2020_010975 [Rehmannia glutinosa]|uniref:Myb/SANT-like domain-containing protein n=1 Tax=Rehmannia glutinosa TaxID=99300 RepID=A0ABR0XC45_REHGL